MDSGPTPGTEEARLRLWVAGSLLLAGCEPGAPERLEGELGFAVQDAVLVPCLTASGEQMVFGLIRSGDGCWGTTPKPRRCEGLSSLLAYPFACQTGAIPMTLSASDSVLIWLENVETIDNLTTASVAAVERRRCGGPPQTMVGEVVIHEQQSPEGHGVTMDLQLDALSGSVNLTVCR